MKDTRIEELLKEAKEVMGCCCWESDKCCRNCRNYKYGNICEIDDKRFSPDYYCSHFYPIY